MKIFGKKKDSLGDVVKKRLLGNFDVNASKKQISVFFKEQLKDVIEKYKTSSVKLQDIPGTNYNLGLYHMKQGNLGDAIMRFKMVNYLKPENIDSFYNLGRCLILNGENKKAKEALQKVLEKNQEHVEAKYLINKIDSPDKIESIPTSLIKEVVELRAEYYREDYRDAGYVGANLLVAEVLRNIEDKNPNLTVLDLGCGTGECGKILKQRGVAKQVTGVDLSRSMMKYSSSRKVDGERAYDILHQAEISEYLKSETNKYDVVVADLSFDLLGRLEPVAKYIHSALNNGGYLAIIMRTEDVKSGYKINLDFEHFSYSDTYIKDVFNKNGFNLLNEKEIEIVGDEKGMMYILVTVS
jgi:predicted TPR repeat methyltransferase